MLSYEHHRKRDDSQLAKGKAASWAVCPGRMGLDPLRQGEMNATSSLWPSHHTAELMVSPYPPADLTSLKPWFCVWDLRGKQRLCCVCAEAEGVWRPHVIFSSRKGRKLPGLQTLPWRGVEFSFEEFHKRQASLNVQILDVHTFVPLWSHRYVQMFKVSSTPVTRKIMQFSKERKKT